MGMSSSWPSRPPTRRSWPRRIRPTAPDGSTATTPANNASGVARDANIVVTFSEPVTLTDPAFTLSCGTSGAHTVAVSGGPITYTLDPAPPFAFSEQCTLTVNAANVKDVDTND